MVMMAAQTKLDLPKVSIIIPAYNSEKTIEQTIGSAITQTYPGPIEVVIVDDFSTDKTVEIAEEYEKKFKNVSGILCIKVFKNSENQGIGANRNNGILNASGEYLCFISADDILNANYVERMLEAQKNDHGCFLFSDYLMINKDGKIVFGVKAPIFDSYQNFVLACIEAAKQDTMFVCYNLFGSTKLFKENMFRYDLRFGEDLYHLLYCLLHKKIKFIHVPEVLFSYRLSETMTTALKKDKIHENNNFIRGEINRAVGKKIFEEAS